MFFKRRLSSVFNRFAKFPVVVVLGPRQSGKTTLVKNVFNKHTYITLENPENLTFITEDPQGFLKTYENAHGIILDEFQHALQFLSYIQIEVDEKNRPGYFVLTGSQNFLMNQSITQTLAGRTGILTLLPLAIHELRHNNLLPLEPYELIFHGSYPRLYNQQFLPQELYPSYIHSYIERDVRQIINVENLRTFQTFMRLCAGRIGQQLNITDLATNCSINHKTATQWLSLLEASYILFLLKPHFNNFNKRLTKTPKLYFYDTGIACSLLGIRSAQDLQLSPFKGALFESLMIADFYKQFYNNGLEPHLYFWRDQNGRIEVDCIVDKGIQLVPIEIKSGQTINPDYFKALTEWNAIAQTDSSHNYVVYAGTETQKRTAGSLIPWHNAGSLIEKIENIKKT